MGYADDGLIEEEDDDPRLPPCFDERGLRILTERCSTCIFRPGNLMHLDDGRLKDMLESVIREDSFVVCHQSLGRDLGDVCRGSYEAHKGQMIRIAERINAINWVTPQSKETV